jgi:hypothetical protein
VNPSATPTCSPLHAPTQAARRDLIAGFFEPTDEDAEQGLKVPGLAHRAIALLVKRGLVRVIVTTNFDRLSPSRRPRPSPGSSSGSSVPSRYDG